ASSDGTVRLWELSVGGLPTRVIQPALDSGPAMHHVDLSGQAAVYLLIAESELVFAPAHAGGRRVLAGGAPFLGRLWDVESGRPPSAPLTGLGPVFFPAFDRTGRRVVGVSGPSTARVWDVVAGQPVGPPLPHGGRVRAAAFAPEGRRVALGSVEGTSR